jgi:ABC-type sugar transport system ATPase subunit
MIHQELSPDAVHDGRREYLDLGREPLERFGFDRSRRRWWRIRTAELLKRLKIVMDPEHPVMRDLSAWRTRQMVEIAKAISYDSSDVLIMDEPTSATYGTRSGPSLQDYPGRCARQGQSAIIYITHKMNEVFEIADEFLGFPRWASHIGTCASRHRCDPQRA